jgi:hypothetical protein
MVNGPSANQRVLADIAKTLRAVDKDDLVELLSDLVKIYVIEGTTALDVAPSGVESTGARERIGFARLIADLKTKFDLPELDYFRVEGDRVLITIGDQTFPLDGPPARRRTAPADAPKRAAPAKRDDGPKPPAGERSRLLEVD